MALKTPLNNSIHTYLIDAMQTGVFANCEHLPRESVLSEQLGISRTQLRDILASLEREGFITRRHGIGTVINHHVLKVPVRMDIEVEFLEMIRRSGYDAAVKSIQTSEIEADNLIAKQLQITLHAPILRVERVCTADGKPAIYCEDYIAKSLVEGSYNDEDLQLPIFYFLRKICNTEPHLDLTEIHPAVADEKLSAIFECSVGTPLLYLEEVDYNIDGRPILYSKEYFIDGVFHHTVLRKKL